MPPPASPSGTGTPGDNERRWGDIIEPVARSAGRGVSYWTDGAGDERIFVVTPSFQLVALDAGTGDARRGLRHVPAWST